MTALTLTHTATTTAHLNQALALADVGLTGADAIALSGLVAALLAGCPAIAELDLRLNQLGGCSAANA
jgi:uncharacterized protein YciW